MRAHVIVGAFVGLFETAHADPPRIDEAIDRAAAEHKTLIIELYTTWCGPCHVFETEILPDARVKSALASDVMFVRYDAEENPGTVVAARYDVYSYPTFLAIDKQRVVRFRHGGLARGNAGIAQFLKLVADARAATEDESDVRARLAANPGDVRAELVAARWFADHEMRVDALAHYDRVAHNPYASPAACSEAWRSTAQIERTAHWKRQIIDEKVEVIRRAPGGATAQDVAIATVDSGLQLSESRSLFAVVFTMQTDADALNELVYVALAAGAKEEALFGAKKMVTARRDGVHLDALAECYAALGDRRRAIQLEDEAVSSSNGTRLAHLFEHNRSRFESGTGESPDVVQVRLKTADLWTRMKSIDQLASRIEDPERKAASMRRFNDRVALYKAQQSLEDALHAACDGTAERTHLAVARIKVDYLGRIIDPVLLLEQNAPDALRACLLDMLSRRTLPVEQSYEPPLMLTVRFDGVR